MKLAALTGYSHGLAAGASAKSPRYQKSSCRSRRLRVPMAMAQPYRETFLPQSN
jgi:hypothetical protein